MQRFKTDILSSSEKSWCSFCINLWDNLVLLGLTLNELVRENNPRKMRKHNLFIPAIVAVPKEMLISKLNSLAFYMFELIKNFNDRCINLNADCNQLAVLLLFMVRIKFYEVISRLSWRFRKILRPSQNMWTSLLQVDFGEFQTSTMSFWVQRLWTHCAMVCITFWTIINSNNNKKTYIPTYFNFSCMFLNPNNFFQFEF